jgi:hypothetical protein
MMGPVAALVLHVLVGAVPEDAVAGDAAGVAGDVAGVAGDAAGEAVVAVVVAVVAVVAGVAGVVPGVVVGKGRLPRHDRGLTIHLSTSVHNQCTFLFEQTVLM